MNTAVALYTVIAAVAILFPGNQANWEKKDAAGAQTIVTQAVPVSEKAAYLLTFKAACAADSFYALENNPRAQDIRLENRNLYPSWTVICQDASGNRVGAYISSPHQTVITGKETEYRTLFYAPTKAAKVVVEFRCPKSQTVKVTEVKLNQLPASDQLVLNPDFTASPHGVPGWRELLPGSGLRNDDGKTVFDSAYGSATAPLPVDPNSCYRLNITGRHYGGYKSLRVTFFDGANKRLKQIGLKPDTEKGYQLYFVPPVSSETLVISVYNTFISKLTLTKVGPKEVIEQHTP